MNISLRIFFLFVLGITLNTASVASGQTVNDPLKKPDTWKRLIEDPKNDNLWHSYFGKDLFELTATESRDYKLWKSQLILAQRKKQEEEREKLLDKFKTEESYVAKSPYLRNLMSNISKNFMLIEDFFDDEFSKHGAKYDFYEDKYPKGDFNKISWIEENEKKLIELTRKS